MSRRWLLLLAGIGLILGFGLGSLVLDDRSPGSRPEQNSRGEAAGDSSAADGPASVTGHAPTPPTSLADGSSTTDTAEVDLSEEESPGTGPPTTGPPIDAASPTTNAPGDTAPTTAPEPTVDATAEASVIQAPTMLVWTSGGLPTDAADRVASAAGVAATSHVVGGRLEMVGSKNHEGVEVDRFTDGWRITLDALGVDPSTYPTFLQGPDRLDTAALNPGEVLLSQTSAELRRLAAGATIELVDGTELRVVGIVSDVAAAGAEVIMTTETAMDFGISVGRHVLVDYEGQRHEVEASVRDALGPGQSIRVRISGETPFLRYGDAVHPETVIKSVFGEFSYRSAPGRNIEIDPGWVAENIVTEPVPILGDVTCHRLFLPLLREAMERLVADGQSHLVDPSNFAGCFSPRRIAAGQPLSRHAWGIAVDLNIGANPRGSFSTQDPRLVETLTATGASWGGEWLYPDPGHYEWRRFAVTPSGGR